MDHIARKVFINSGANTEGRVTPVDRIEIRADRVYADEIPLPGYHAYGLIFHFSEMPSRERLEDFKLAYPELSEAQQLALEARYNIQVERDESAPAHVSSITLWASEANRTDDPDLIEALEAVLDLCFREKGWYVDYSAGLLMENLNELDEAVKQRSPSSVSAGWN